MHEDGTATENANHPIQDRFLKATAFVSRNRTKFLAAGVVILLSTNRGLRKDVRKLEKKNDTLTEKLGQTNYQTMRTREVEPIMDAYFSAKRH